MKRLDQRSRVTWCRPFEVHVWREPGDLSCQVTVQALDTNEYVLGSKPHGELFITKFMAKRAARKAMLAACRTPPNERL